MPVSRLSLTDFRSYASASLEPGAGFEVETNRVTILDRDGGEQALPLMDKRAVADGILDAIEARCV